MKRGAGKASDSALQVCTLPSPVLQAIPPCQRGVTGSNKQRPDRNIREHSAHTNKVQQAALCNAHSRKLNIVQDNPTLTYVIFPCNLFIMKPPHGLLPRLPTGAAYLYLSNPRKRNALSLATLRSLRDQLVQYNTSPITGQRLFLPPFQPKLISNLEAAVKDPANHEHGWLVSAKAWQRQREGLPNAIVLASDPDSKNVFCSGHDLSELSRISGDQVKETFALCAEVMSLIRRSPVLVVGRITGLASAAGCQLALSTDLPIAHGQGTQFQLPGAMLGLPCSSPVTAVSRRIGNARAFRMLALAERMSAEELSGEVRVVRGGEAGGVEAMTRALDEEVRRTVDRLVSMPAQQSAMGKWAFWTQVGLRGQGQQASASGDDVLGQSEGSASWIEGSGGDGYEDAVVWAGRVMALHAKSEEAKEGMDAFVGKRSPVWTTAAGQN